MPTSPENLPDFEAFWIHFLRGHRHPGTRWAHVAALGLGGAGLAIGLRGKKKRLVPIALGAAGFAGLAILSHPLFEGNWPENFGRPLWAARAFTRLCLRTLTGAVKDELSGLDAAA